ncbi:MAG: glucose-6-phosphate isomerase [Candidatus Improbicoccus devescovinae]|nr:MAG: glucose-6-phosphate isomerase [Candidatus Improbicoccus devescovinae]
MLFDDKFLCNFINSEDYNFIMPAAHDAFNMLESRNGPGCDMLGWLDCFNLHTKKILEIAEYIRANSQIVIIIGIGGSFLGAKAAIDFLGLDNFNNNNKIYFLGNTMDPEPLLNVLNKSQDKDVFLLVISKSGSTLEIMSAFQVLLNFMIGKYKQNFNKKMVIITNKTRGFLREFVNIYNCESFEIPENIGGRYSILTPAALLPIAIAGGNITKILDGAASVITEFKNFDFKNNICLKYAIIRNILYKKNKLIEILVSYNQRLLYFLLWWQQLFAESEGKNNKGIFPTYLLFSRDLHSMGQFIQEGSKICFETVICVENLKTDVKIDDSFYQKYINFTKNKSFNYINSQILDATIRAHTQGGTPCGLIKLKDFSEKELGKVVFFFEKSCAISAYILGVNPFNQPGVEEYKKNIHI